MKIKLQKPLQLDDKTIHEIELNLEKLTGADMVEADREARMSGIAGLDPLYTQEGLTIIASKASGIIREDLLKLSAPDFLEVTANVTNFLMGWVLPQTKDVSNN